MSSTPDTHMITQEQAAACLQILGLDGPVPTPGELPRADAIGHLLFLVEAAVLADIDRLDQEALRAGYNSAAITVITGSMGIAGDAGTLYALHLLARLAEDRLRRTRLSLTDLDTPVGNEGGWSLFPAVDAALDGMLALLDRKTPAFVFDGSSPDEVQSMRDAIEFAETSLRTSLSRLAAGTQLAERLAQA